MIKQRSVYSLTLLLLFLLLPFQSQAIIFLSTNGLTYAKSDVILQEFWANTDQAQISGTFENDFFLLCQNADLTGNFNMDLWCVAQAVMYTGLCESHARLAGTSVDMRGAVKNNFIGIGNTVDLTTNAFVGGNTLLVGETVMFQGTAASNVTIYAVRATLGGDIAGLALLVADDIVVMPHANIRGNLEYISGDELVLDPSVTIEGELVRREISSLPGKEAPTSLSNQIMLQAFFYLSMLITGMLWFFLFPRLSGCAVIILRENTLRCFFIGLLVLVAVPSLAVLLFISLFGIPLAIISIVTYGSVVYVSKIITACYIGLFFFRKRIEKPAFNRIFIILSSGLLIMYVMTLLPGAAFAVWLLTTCGGLGALTLAAIKLRREQNMITALPEVENAPPATDNS